MAFTHVQISSTVEHGADLKTGMRQFETGRTQMIRSRDTMTTMIDGDGSNAAQFTEVTARYGTGSNADSKALWDELNSFLAKQTTDEAVTNVKAATEQLLSKFR